jgi:hypothetical protein
MERIALTLIAAAAKTNDFFIVEARHSWRASKGASLRPIVDNKPLLSNEFPA